MNARGFASESREPRSSHRQLYLTKVEPLRQLNRLDAAESVLRLMIQSRTTVPEVYRDLARLAEQRGLEQEASSWTDAWLALEPDAAEQRWEQASQAILLGRSGRALDHLERLLAIDPLHQAGLMEAARLQLRFGYTKRALRSLQTFLDLALVDRCEALAAAAMCALELGRFEAAASWVRDCLESQDESPWKTVARAVQARLLQHQGLEEEALAMVQPLWERDDAPWPVSRILAPLLLEQQQLTLLQPVLDRACSLQPDADDLQLIKAELHWLRHDLQQGFRAYQARQLSLHGCGLPAYQPGQPVQGPLAIVAEGTLGDTLLFSRYAPWLQQHLGVEVRLYVQPPLLTLLRQSLGPEILVASYSSLAEQVTGQVLPLLSAPAFFGTCLEHPELRRPHLIAQPELVESWRDALELSADQRLIGINWHGSALQALSERHRSDIPLQQLAPLAELPRVKLLSFQRGIGLDQLESCSFAQAFVACQSQVNREHRLEHIAALMTLCDWIVTDDSGPAHLAGCLGVPSMVLLPSRINWRWASTGPVSPWYPSCRLLRQVHGTGWAPLVQEVCDLIG